DHVPERAADLAWYREKKFCPRLQWKEIRPELPDQEQHEDAGGAVGHRLKAPPQAADRRRIGSLAAGDLRFKGLGVSHYVFSPVFTVRCAKGTPSVQPSGCLRSAPPRSPSR